jgi:hypothetical protein
MNKKLKRTNTTDRIKNTTVNIPNVKYTRDLMNQLTGQGCPEPAQANDSISSSDPQTQIEQILETINSEALRKFLQCVLEEREVCQAVSQLAKRRHKAGHLYRIEQLDHAASITRTWLDWIDPDKETLYVATLIRGIQELLTPQIVGNSCTPSNLMFSIVCSALRRLDDEAPRQAWLLRLALGWGNEDEIDAVYIPRIHHIVNRALCSVGLINQPMALS